MNSSLFDELVVVVDVAFSLVVVVTRESVLRSDTVVEVAGGLFSVTVGDGVDVAVGVAVGLETEAR
ncbi:hypothetical protein ACFQJ8_11250 [Halocatena marina]|uniref:hypothetical protein n=1 Tax=Halocatena marina TaxID=2934937 RepID=UPI00360F7E09